MVPATGRCGGYPGAHTLQGHILPHLGGSLLGEGADWSARTAAFDGVEERWLRG